MYDSLIATFLDIGFAQVLAIWAAIVLAALIRSFTGFGFALAAMPVLSLFLAPIDAVVLAAELTLAVSLLTVKTFWGATSARPLAPIVLCAVFGTALGALTLRHFSVAQFQLWIGLAVIIACALLTFYHPKPRTAGIAVRSFTGLCSGLMNGALAIPGPPIIIFTMATEPDARRSRAMLMIYFMMTSLMAVLIYTSLGYVVLRSLALFALGLPAMLIGDRVGHALFARFGTQMYRGIALGLLYVVGISTTLRALLG